MSDYRNCSTESKGLKFEGNAKIHAKTANLSGNMHSNQVSQLHTSTSIFRIVDKNYKIHDAKLSIDIPPVIKVWRGELGIVSCGIV